MWARCFASSVPFVIAEGSQGLDAECLMYAVGQQVRRATEQEHRMSSCHCLWVDAGQATASYFMTNGPAWRQRLGFSQAGGHNMCTGSHGLIASWSTVPICMAFVNTVYTALVVQPSLHQKWSTNQVSLSDIDTMIWICTAVLLSNEQEEVSHNY